MRTALLAALVVTACHSEPPPQKPATDDLQIEKMPPVAAAPVKPVAMPIAQREPFHGTCGDHSTGNPAPPVANAKVGVGQVTLVYYWATWCAPCQQDFRGYEKIWAKNKDRGMDMIAISVDDENTGLHDFANQNGGTFPLAWDVGHKDANCWHVDTMPTTFVVDRTGVIRFVHNGSHSGEADKVAEEIESLL